MQRKRVKEKLVIPTVKVKVPKGQPVDPINTPEYIEAFDSANGLKPVPYTFRGKRYGT